MLGVNKLPDPRLMELDNEGKTALVSFVQAGLDAPKMLIRETSVGNPRKYR